jgi:hypothetical protein
MKSLLVRQPRHGVKVGSGWRQLRARWQQELIRASILVPTQKSVAEGSGNYGPQAKGRQLHKRVNLARTTFGQLRQVCMRQSASCHCRRASFCWSGLFAHAI